MPALLRFWRDEPQQCCACTHLVANGGGSVVLDLNPALTKRARLQGWRRAALRQDAGAGRSEPRPYNGRRIGRLVADAAFYGGVAFAGVAEEVLFFAFLVVDGEGAAVGGD
jgi:hypothetical protein